MNLWFNDPKTKEPSVTLTAFMTGFLVATAKLLLSGVTIGGLTLAPFTGGDFAAAVGAVGAIYWARRNVEMGKSE
jgi:hypothetical protein